MSNKKIIFKSFNNIDNYNLEKENDVSGKILVDKLNKRINIDGVELQNGNVGSTFNNLNIYIAEKNNIEYNRVLIHEAWYSYSNSVNNIIDDPSLFFRSKNGFSKKKTALMSTSEARGYSNSSRTQTMQIYKVDILTPSFIKLNIKTNDSKVIIGSIFKTKTNGYGYAVYEVLDSYNLWSAREIICKFNAEATEHYMFFYADRYFLTVNSIDKLLQTESKKVYGTYADRPKPNDTFPAINGDSYFFTDVDTGKLGIYHNGNWVDVLGNIITK